VAVKGDRIVAVGFAQHITRLAGPSTRRIDLKGKSVLPPANEIKEIQPTIAMVRGKVVWDVAAKWQQQFANGAGL